MFESSRFYCSIFSNVAAHIKKKNNLLRGIDTLSKEAILSKSGCLPSEKGSALK